MTDQLIRLNFIHGLSEIVANEVEQYPNLPLHSISTDSIYLASDANLHAVLQLQSPTNAYLVKQGKQLHPAYLSNHKSILMDIVEEVLLFNNHTMRTFSLSCAGSDTDEVASLKRHIETQYKLVQQTEHGDLKIYIGKQNTIWEIGVELTAKPLSTRDYKVAHIKGGIHPTVAYAMNMLGDVRHRTSYLNIFSGSATLLIEAARMNPSLRPIGFDNNKEHLSLSIQNIRQAALLQTIQVKYADIFDRPEFGTFDMIVSDLPFGMHIGKDQDLHRLYDVFISYCTEVLAPNGVLVLYTTETDLLESVLEHSPFSIEQTLPLKIVTNVGSYIYPKIYLCSAAIK